MSMAGNWYCNLVDFRRSLVFMLFRSLSVAEWCPARTFLHPTKRVLRHNEPGKPLPATWICKNRTTPGADEYIENFQLVIGMIDPESFRQFLTRWDKKAIV
jgi:hypothetical protein